MLEKGVRMVLAGSWCGRSILENRMEEKAQLSLVKFGVSEQLCFVNEHGIKTEPLKHLWLNDLVWVIHTNSMVELRLELTFLPVLCLTHTIPFSLLFNSETSLR